MKKSHANPTAIGAFVLGAMAIAVTSIILFGSGRWLGGERASFVCLFDDAVDGLQIGSKVKLKGVPVGEVKGILLRFRQQTDEGQASTKPLIPVIIELDVAGVEGLEWDEESAYQAQIEAGLRASLGISNLITGILQVNLDYHEKAEPAGELEHFRYEGETYRVIPTLPSQMARATNDLLGVVNNISKADFKGVVDGLNELLAQLSKKLDQFEVNGMNEALASFQARMESPKFDAALESFSEAAEAVTGASKSVREVADNLDHQLSDEVLGGAVTSADETFQSLRDAIENLNALITSNQNVPGKLETSLEEVGEMAAAIKELADYLAEHPSSLIWGRKDKEGRIPEDERRQPWRGGVRR